MKYASRVLLIALVFGFALLWGAKAAEAQKRRVAVLDIEGARNQRLRDDVAKLIRKKHEVLSSSRYRKAAVKARARRMRPKDVRRVAALLDVDGVLEGQLVAEDSGYVLRLRLREGATGKTVRKFTVFLKSPRMSRKLGKQLSQRLRRAINNLEPIAADEDAWSEEDEQADLEAERRARKAERRRLKRERAEERKRMKAERRERVRERREERPRARDVIDDSDIEAIRGVEDDDDDFDDDDSNDFDRDSNRDDVADDDRPTVRRSAPNPRTAAVTVNAGATVIGRKLTFTTRPDIATPPSQYKGAYAPGATLSGELYPMALDSDSESPAKNVGLGFDLERSVGLSSQISTADGMQAIKLPTQRQKYGFQAQYRHHFGTQASHPTVTLSIGWSKLSFTIDKSQVPEGITVDLPDVVYRYIDPGVKLRLPAGNKLAIITGAKFMAITGAGPIVSAEQYGQSSVIGFDGDVAVEYRAAPEWLVRAGAHFNYIGYTFKAGAGELSSNRDGNLDDLDVGGAADRYLGGYVTAGYLY